MVRLKDNIATIATVLTMLFKIFIFGSVLITYSIISLNWIGYLAIILSGTIWVLGLQNVMLFYYVFKRK